jgi:hypothetical protein
VRLVFKNKSSA